MIYKYIGLASLMVTLVCTSCGRDDPKIEIRNALEDMPVKHGTQALQRIAGNNTLPLDPGWIVTTALDTHLGKEAFTIESSGKNVKVTGGDPVGVMYGLLDVKEQLANGKNRVEKADEAPRFPFRALKFNLPWDSYRRGKALQLHAETCRDTTFWQAFLDMMAENRFNALTLWNLHPFNYMVRTEKYPEACGFSDEELAGWQTFWKALFRMAKERGIETYLVNWNIFVSSEFAAAHDVATYCLGDDYFVDNGDTSEIIKDYMREAVKTVIDTYPNLTGLGITLGEAMGGMTAGEREQWLLDSFIEGMRMASRKIKFIHRVPLSAGKGSGGSTDVSVERMTRRTLDSLSCVKSPIEIELKFNWSHGHSCTDLVKVHGGKLTDAYWNPFPQNYKLAWMIRNEDFFALRWGQPSFIRDHIAKNGEPYVNGYFVGSECYIPAKDYITALPNTSYRYAFDRQWMFYKEWGRLLYDPETPDQVFLNAFERKFPGKGNILFEAQKKVSRIPLIIASYWNATWDNTLYSEGMLSIMGKDRMKLISLEDMCDKVPMDPDYMSIREFLDHGMKDAPGRITPVELSDSINIFCGKALRMIRSVATEGNNDLLYEVSDIRAWANLGMYFSHKLRAAIAYQRYLDTGDREFLHQAVTWLENAAMHWHKLSEVTSTVYRPMPMQHYERNGDIPFHWSIVEGEVLAELDWLKRLSVQE